MLEAWLKEALKQSGMGQAELSRRLTERLGRSIDRAAVNKMLKGPGPGGRKIYGDEVIAISNITGFPPPPAELVSAEIRPVLPAFTTVRVKGFVQAGSWVENPEWPYDDWQEIKITPVNEYPGIELHACQVRGPSMNRLYPDGTILVWVNIHETMEQPVSGRRYIVRRARNNGAEYEMTVKTYIENDTGRWLIAESDQPEFQGAIKIAEDDTDQVEIVGRVIRSIREE